MINFILSSRVHSYAGIDTDPELKYPKGGGRVSFDNYNSYINAINSRFVHVKSADMDKRVCFPFTSKLYSNFSLVGVSA